MDLFASGCILFAFMNPPDGFAEPTPRSPDEISRRDAAETMKIGTIIRRVSPDSTSA